jgi:hypothetical protein
VVDGYSKSFGLVEEGQLPTVSFRITNHYEHPVTIVGRSTRCGFAVTSELPMVLPPHATRSIHVTIYTGRQSGSISDTVRLFTNQPGHLRIDLRVRGQVSTAHDDSGRRPLTGAES